MAPKIHRSAGSSPRSTLPVQGEGASQGGALRPLLRAAKSARIVTHVITRYPYLVVQEPEPAPPSDGFPNTQPSGPRTNGKAASTQRSTWRPFSGSSLPCGLGGSAPSKYCAPPGTPEPPAGTWTRRRSSPPSASTSDRPERCARRARSLHRASRTPWPTPTSRASGRAPRSGSATACGAGRASARHPRLDRPCWPQSLRPGGCGPDALASGYGHVGQRPKPRSSANQRCAAADTVA